MAGSKHIPTMNGSFSFNDAVKILMEVIQYMYKRVQNIKTMYYMYVLQCKYNVYNDC